MKLYSLFSWLRDSYRSLLAASYPLFFAALILYFTTILLYEDIRHLRVASAVENILLQEAQNIVGPFTMPSDLDIATVTLTEKDAETRNVQLQGDIREGMLADYTTVIREILNQNPRALFISWSTNARREPASAYGPLLAILTEAKQRNIPVVFAYPLGRAYPIHAGIESLAIPVSDLNCQEPLNLACPFVPQYQDWLGTWVYDLARPDLTSTTTPQHSWVSEYLPLSFPSFILYLPRATGLLAYNFSEILERKIRSTALTGKLVFLGSALIQSEDHGEDSDVLRRVLTHEHRNHSELRTTGTPYHVFWAQVATQFRADKLVAVAPVFLVLIIALTLSIFVFWLVLSHSTTRAVLLISASMVSIFLSNLFAIKFGRMYLPMFDIFYAAIATLLLSQFAALSANLWRASHLRARKNLHRYTRDLKENFISMFSHNLNTPLAKLSGTMDIILMQMSQLPQSAVYSVQQCSLLVTKMQHVVRLALLANTVKDRGAHFEVLTQEKLYEELNYVCASQLRKLGFVVELQHTPNSDEGHELFNARIDRRVFPVALMEFAMIWQRNNDHAERPTILLGIHAQEDQSGFPIQVQMRFMTETPKGTGTFADVETLDDGLEDKIVDRYDALAIRLGRDFLSTLKVQKLFNFKDPEAEVVTGKFDLSIPNA